LLQFLLTFVSQPGMNVKAIDLSSVINTPAASSSSSKSAGVSIIQIPDAKKYNFALGTLITVAPAVVKKPADIAPTGLVINGVKSSYDMNSTLSIDPSFVVDGDGWKDINKVNFWLTDSKGKRIELSDATSFAAKDPKDNNSAKFSYSTSLNGIAAGDYKLNAVAYDKFGAVSNQFTQAIGIKTVYQIGFDSSTNKINASVLNLFTKLNGVQILGKATNNIHSTAGGTVQDFEKGSIFQSATGIFSLQGSLNNFYNALSTADKLRLGMPTANETSVGGYLHQSFQNGDLQLVQGMPVKWSDLTLITDQYNLLGGATALGKSVGIIHDLNGGKVQDYEKGSIFAYGNKTVAVVGSIAAYYRANSATLGLPTGEESITSYGKRQDFQGAVVTSSAQFGVHTLHGSVVGFYTGLTAAQKDQLGAATTEEAVGGDGNWQQFFKGGSVLWKSNGTGELKLTPFTIGFGGDSIIPVFRTEFNKVVGSDGGGVNPAFTTKFNAVVGWESLGKATGNVRSINGGTVQDFEKGSIFQSAAGTFSLQGTLNNFYKGLSAADKLRLGMPTANETNVGGWHQSFQNGELQLVQGMPVKWSDLTLITDRYNLLDGATALGKSVGTIHDLNGGKVQDYEKGSIFAYGNKTVAVVGSIAAYYRANSATLGLPTGEESITSYGKRQDFQGAVVTSSAQFGVHTLHGSVVGFYTGLTAAQKDQLGAATTEEAVGGDGNWQQFFKGGSVLWKSNGTGELKLTPFTIGFDGSSVNTVFTNEFNKVVGWDALGKATGNVRSIDGGKVQDFEKGSLFQTSTGIKVVKDAIGIYFIGNSSQLGLQKGVLRDLGNGKTYQEFDKGIVFNSPTGVSAIYGDMVKTYLDYSQLGIPVGAAIDVGNGITRQNLENGAIFTSTQFGTHAAANGFWTLYKGLTMAQQQDFGMPITDPANSSSGDLRQNFQGGFITIGSDYGSHVVAGKINSYYKTLTEDQRNKLDIPTTEEISDGKGSTYQFFKGGFIKQTISNGQLISTNILSQFTIGYAGSKMRDSIIKAYVKLADDLGTPTGNVLSINTGYFQDFDLRMLSVSSTGEAFTITQKIADYIRTDKGKTLGSATSEGFSQYYGSQMGSSQSFQNGRVFYHPQFGTFRILGNAQSLGSFGDYYDNVLSLAQRVQLGVPTSEQTDDSIGKLHQSFQGGTIYWQNTDSTKSTFSFSTDSYQPPQTSGGGVITITSNPPNNSGGVITITSNPQPTQPSTPTVQYTIETHTFQVPAQNPLPSPVTNASSSANSSLARNGLDIVYISLSGTVVDTDQVNLRADAPRTSSQLAGKEYRNQTLQFDAWARGEEIEGRTDIWLHIAGSRNWVSARYIQTNSSISELPVSSANFKGIVNSTEGINVRSKPNTNFGKVASYNNQTELSFDGYAKGESINGNDRWYRIAGTQNWVSSYLIFGSPDHSVSLESTRPTTKTETVQVPVYNNPTPSQPSQPSQPSGISVDPNFSNAYAGAGGANGILHNPTSNPIQINGGWQQNFQGGAIISSNRGIFTLYGGIGSYYLQNEGGANGRLGVPTSGEQSIGNGKTVQHFQNGDILYGSGATSTLLAGSAIRYLGASEEFTGTVLPSIGVAFRYTPHENDRSPIARAYNTALPIDAWTYGDTLTDTKLGTPDNKWYHVKGENYWVPSAYIDGGIGRSVLGNNPVNPPVIPPTTNNQNPPGSLGVLIRTGGSTSSNIGIQSAYTDPLQYTGEVWSRIEAEAGNEGKKHLVTINWGAYKREEIIVIPKGGVVLDYQKRYQDQYSRTITVQAINDGVTSVSSKTIVEQGYGSPGPYANIFDANSNWVQDSSIPMPNSSSNTVSAFSKALQFTLMAEGGYSDDPSDLGGPTNYGITQGTYTNSRSNKGLGYKSVSLITQEEAKDIYYQDYWLAPGCDKLSEKLAICHFDASVNSGSGSSQRFLNAAQNNGGSEIDKARAYCNARESFYYEIVKYDARQKTFLQGWLNRLNNLRSTIGI
jgi:uncharacterized protein with LGFP repeats